MLFASGVDCCCFPEGRRRHEIADAHATHLRGKIVGSVEVAGGDIARPVIEDRANRVTAIVTGDRLACQCRDIRRARRHSRDEGIDERAV